MTTKLDANTASQVTTGIGAATSIFGGLTLNDIGVLVGMVIGLIGLLAQWHWAKKTYNLKKLEIETMIGESLDTQS